MSIKWRKIRECHNPVAKAVTGECKKNCLYMSLNEPSSWYRLGISGNMTLTAHKTF